MMYFNETLEPAAMVKAASEIAIPGGRENGDILAWLEEQELDVPAFAGRCLHRPSGA